MRPSFLDTPLDTTLTSSRTAQFFTVVESLYASFSTFERFLVYTAAIVLVFASGLMLKALNQEITAEVPAYGGSFTEGMVGSMRFVNPVLAISDTDRALTSLVYSGLMRDVDGVLVPDLSDGYSVSDDGKTYTFTIRGNARFHDGTPVTADDVLYTIQQTLDPGIKSPRRAEWEGVRVEKTDDHTVTFTLDKPYAGFLKNLTLGILPKHIWHSLTAEEFAFSTNNIRAVGSGPYMFYDVSYKSDGIPSSYTVRSYDDYTLGKPYITTITSTFYPNEDDALAAWTHGSVDALGGLSTVRSSSLPPATPLARATLPRTFAVFFNPQHSTVLADTAVRTALSDLVPRGSIVRTILHGFGNSLAGPLPTDIMGIDNDLTYATQKKAALELLTKAGWTVNPSTNILEKDGKELSLSLATANTDELKDAARTIAESWRTVGVKVKVELYEPGDLQQTIVRPRAFDALFFGEVVPTTIDLFAFWHSSQKDDPGLNIAGFADKDADKYLDKIRISNERDEQNTLYTKFAKILMKDSPAAFVYSPTYTYIPAPDVKHVTLAPSMEGYERFGGVQRWYIESDRVWNFLIN